MSEPVFNEQAYLLWKKFVQASGIAKSNIVVKAGLAGYIPLHRLIGTYDPVSVISKILKPKDADVYHGLLNLETYKLNALVPDIKLFKIFNGKYYPFYFPTAYDPVDSRRIVSSGGTLHAAGIKGFDVRFVGKDMFTRDKLIECSLTFYVESLELIFKEPPAGYAKIADLFTISRKNQALVSDGAGKEVPANLIRSPSSFEIAATLGYHAPAVKDLFKRSEIDAIESTHLSMRMTMNEHSISVNPDGSANIDVKYHARLAGLLSGGAFDTMSSNMNILEGIADIKAQQELSTRGHKANTTKTKDAKKMAVRKIKTATTAIFKDWLGTLDRDGRVKTLDISPKDMKEFRKYQKLVSKAKKKGKDSKANALNSGAPIKAASPAPSENSVRPGKVSPKNIRARSANYILLGDLIETVLVHTKLSIQRALSTAKSEMKSNPAKKKKKTLDRRLKYLVKALKQFKTFKILLANIPICVGENKYVNINVSDIPIAVSLYYTWVWTRVTQLNKTKYTVEQFLDDCVSYLIVNALDGAATKDLKFLGDNLASVKSLSLTGGDPWSSRQERKPDINVKDLPSFLKRIPAKNLKDEIDYYIIYAEPTPQLPSSRKGDLIKDIKDGIYHFHLGHDRGLLKNITFSKFEVGSMRESLMVNSVSLYDELKMPYTATLTLFGNNLFLPGSMIYINPASIGFGDPRNKRSAAVRLGFGGYYTVLDVHTTLTGNEMTTVLQTSYVSWADSASSLISELADRAKKSDDTKPDATTDTVTPTTTEPDPRPAHKRSVNSQSDLTFVVNDRNLTSQEKAAVQAIYRYGTDSEQFRTADEASGNTTYRIEPQDKAELAKLRRNRVRPNTILVQITRPNGEKFVVRRSGADASITQPPGGN